VRHGIASLLDLGGVLTDNSRWWSRPPTVIWFAPGGLDRCLASLKVESQPTTEFMMVPALVAITPPIIAPAIIFGESRVPPLHFSQANLPPA
jgi:hypothetical protein